jgi:arylsulfatase A-like enzyme
MPRRGPLLADQPQTLQSAWSFVLPDSNPAWLKIQPAAGAEQDSTAQVDLLWSVGSARPAGDVQITGDRSVSFRRQLKWKPGGGKITKKIVESSNANRDRRPNVLIIYGDDQGSIDMGCFGVDDLKTPSMDRLADQGLKLTRMYAPAPVCSASRIGLLTGRYPARVGQAGNGPLPTEETTIAEVFQKAGYATGHVGKWHLGKTPKTVPAGQGFDRWFGHLEGCIDNFSHFFYWSGPNRHDLWDNGKEVQRPGEYFPELMVDRCKQFIDRQNDRQGEQPWMLYWAFNAPHYPYQGSPKWLEHYQHLPTPRREYCAFLSTMDEYIGKVLDHLESRGLAENTIVVYQPDHGHSTETRAFGGGGNAGPYRGAKFSLFEGGIRVPAVVRYPGVLPAGETRDQFLTGCDWLPTLCEWCDVELPDVKLDGISVAEILAENRGSQRDTFYWQMGNGRSPQWAVRKGNWKLIGNPRDTTLPQTEQINGGRLEESMFLVDLETDPGEQANLANSHPEKLAELKRLREQLVEGFETVSSE